MYTQSANTDKNKYLTNVGVFSSASIFGDYKYQQNTYIHITYKRAKIQ